MNILGLDDLISSQNVIGIVCLCGDKTMLYHLFHCVVHTLANILIAAICYTKQCLHCIYSALPIDAYLFTIVNFTIPYGDFIILSYGVKQLHSTLLHTHTASKVL